MKLPSTSHKVRTYTYVLISMQYTTQLSSRKMTGTEYSLTRRLPSNVYRVSYVHFLWPSSYNTICLPPQTLGSAHHGISKGIISVRNIAASVGVQTRPAQGALRTAPIFTQSTAVQVPEHEITSKQTNATLISGGNATKFGVRHRAQRQALR